MLCCEVHAYGARMLVVWFGGVRCTRAWLGQGPPTLLRSTQTPSALWVGNARPSHMVWVMVTVPAGRVTGDGGALDSDPSFAPARTSAQAEHRGSVALRARRGRGPGRHDQASTAIGTPTQNTWTKYPLSTHVLGVVMSGDLRRVTEVDNERAGLLHCHLDRSGFVNGLPAAVAVRVWSTCSGGVGRR